MSFYNNFMIQWSVISSNGILSTVHPSILICFLWIILALIAIVVIVWSREEEILANVRDKCEIGHYPFQFLVVMSFSDFSKTFSKETILQFAFYSKNNRFITRFTAPPKVLKDHSYYIEENKRALRFVLSRGMPLKDIAFF